MNIKHNRTPPELEAHGKWQLVSVIAVVFVAIAAIVVWMADVRLAAEREYAAYEKLCSLGATGDDWVSFLEFVTGRPPIVQIDIPVEVSPDTTFKLIRHLRNLESLTLAYDSLSDQEIDVIDKLELTSLEFNEGFPSDADVDRLASFRDVRFIQIPSGNLSVEAQAQVKQMLPTSKIAFD